MPHYFSTLYRTCLSPAKKKSPVEISLILGVGGIPSLALLAPALRAEKMVAQFSKKP